MLEAKIMKLTEIKSIYHISLTKYIWTIITGKHYKVTGITINNSEEKIEFIEPLITISKSCFILTDIDPSIQKKNKRTPIIIKLLKNEQNQNVIHPGMKGYEDENNESVTLMKFSPTSFVLGFNNNGNDIALNLKK
jgi:hypothetical protein